MITYKKHAKDWQRPLKNTEVACYYSHQNAWGKIIQSNEPMLSPVLATNFFLFLFSRLINSHFFLSARSASSFGVYLDSSTSSSKINAERHRAS
jgi:hypothetical protein